MSSLIFDDFDLDLVTKSNPAFYPSKRRSKQQYIENFFNQLILETFLKKSANNVRKTLDSKSFNLMRSVSPTISKLEKGVNVPTTDPNSPSVLGSTTSIFTEILAEDQENFVTHTSNHTKEGSQKFIKYSLKVLPPFTLIMQMVCKGCVLYKRVLIILE